MCVYLNEKVHNQEIFQHLTGSSCNYTTNQVTSCQTEVFIPFGNYLMSALWHSDSYNGKCWHTSSWITQNWFLLLSQVQKLCHQ